MADRVMRFPGVTIALVAVLAMAQAASAQTMADPTRPPAALAENAGEASVPPEMVLQSVLIPNKTKFGPQSHYEFFDILHNGIFQNTFVWFFIGIFNIDKIQQNFIFKSHQCFLPKSIFR